MPSGRHQTYRIETLGCKANVYDSRRLAEALEDCGLRPAPPGRPADVCVLNTCTVTAVADRKGRKLAARLVRENPGARVFLTGCGVEAGHGDLASLPGVTGLFGRGEWRRLVTTAVDGARLPDGALDGDFGIRSFGGRARAFLKVQDGCDAFCAYCILPYVRGRPRSRPLADVGAEARRLVDGGFTEIVVTGIHTGFYGRDLPDRPTLAQAVLAVAETEGIGRVRLSSVEANEVTDELLAAMAHPAVCPHLHLPLQSGDAEVLRAMGRSYRPSEFLHIIARARAALDGPAVTTDVMVGFPGEGEDAFERTVEFCRAARFSRMHVFPFSPRPGTRAAAMAGRPAPDAVRERGRILRGLANELAADWADGFVGRRVRVLLERCSPAGRLSGYTDRYVRLTAAGTPEMVGRVAHARGTARKGMSLAGTLE
jgi:threonylcarbamoyladenosine tRNA methylthiotransferase MtaB